MMIKVLIWEGLTPLDYFFFFPIIDLGLLSLNRENAIIFYFILRKCVWHTTKVSRHLKQQTR